MTLEGFRASVAQSGARYAHLNPGQQAELLEKLRPLGVERVDWEGLKTYAQARAGATPAECKQILQRMKELLPGVEQLGVSFRDREYVTSVQGTRGEFPTNSISKQAQREIMTQFPEVASFSWIAAKDLDFATGLVVNVSPRFDAKDALRLARTTQSLFNDASVHVVRVTDGMGYAAESPARFYPSANEVWRNRG